MQILKPVPLGTFDRAIASSLTWRDAKAALAKHEAHVIVANVSQPEGLAGSIRMAKSITYVLAAIVCLTRVIGVYWARA